MQMQPNRNEDGTEKDPTNKGGADKALDMDGLFNIGGMLGGVSQILNQLGSLAEKGEQLKKSMDIGGNDPSKKVAGSFGYSVKFGGESFGGSRSADGFSTEQHVAPKQTVKQPSGSENSTSRPVQTVREPIVETFEEGNGLLIVAEMPGVSRDNVEIRFVSDSQIMLIGHSSMTRYEKAIDVPAPISRDNVNVMTNNGIVEIRLQVNDGAQS
jgi:HSP20 family protein